MADESLRDAIGAEKDQPWLQTLIDSLVDSFTLLIGGVIGGFAFQITISDIPNDQERLWFLSLIVFGTIALFILRIGLDLGAGIGRYFSN